MQLVHRGCYEQDARNAVFARRGEHTLINGCEVLSEDTTYPQCVMWVIYSDTLFVHKDFQVRYGVVPPGFEQVYPPYGLPPQPLQERMKYPF